MKAAVLHGREELRYEELPTPSPAEDEVLVRVHACGICGSDIPRVLGDGAHFFPIVLGHEFAGEIVELGKNVTQRTLGQRVAAAPLLPCHDCPACQHGDYALCKKYSFIGSRRQGGFAEYVALPARNTVPFDASLPYAAGALFEPSAVALHGLLHSKYAGGRVAVIGCGTIGLLAGQWARILGAKEIVALDIDEKRLGTAKELFADRTALSQNADTLGEFDYICDAVGGEATLILSLSLAGPHATICLIGTPTKLVGLNVSQMESINRKELWLTGSWMGYSNPFPGIEWERTAQEVKKGALLLDERLLHDQLPLSQAAEAFSLYRNPGAVVGRVLLIP